MNPIILSCNMFRTAVFALLLLFSQSAGRAEVYYTDPAGDDAGPGSSAGPWRTIQKGVNAAHPGDTVVVRAGRYDERASTVRGGLTAASRISFVAEGKATMRGWIINHPYITIEGFDITGHSSPSKLDAYVRVDDNGDFVEVLNCTVRDGIGIRREDMVFTAPDQIGSPSGGFLAAGFAPGQSITVARGLNVNLLNASTYVISDLTDTAITVVGSPIVDDGPKPAYITGAENYGLSVAEGTQDGIIRGNIFSNLSYRYCSVHGVRNLFERNILERNNGWDLIFFFGSDHVFRGNHFRENTEPGIYAPSVDVFDNFAAKYERITFTENFVQDLVGVINAQKRNGTGSGPLTISRNVFVDCGWFSGRFPNTTFENNTFLRVARQSNLSVQRENHPLIFVTADYATNAVIRNNVFLDCGQPAGPIPAELVGWYSINGPTNSVVTEGNFVAGAAPLFGAKAVFDEGNPLLNGGDPGLQNIADPLGPDGIPFTLDDGLRLQADSKLRAAGAGGMDVGAYVWTGTSVTPSLSVAVLESNTVLLDLATEAGRSYEVDKSCDLGATHWGALGGKILGTGDTIRISDPTGGAVARCFYRVRVLAN